MVWWRSFLQVLCCIPFTLWALNQSWKSRQGQLFRIPVKKPFFTPTQRILLFTKSKCKVQKVKNKKYSRASALFLFTLRAAIFGSQEVVRNFQLSNKESEDETSNVDTVRYGRAGFPLHQGTSSCRWVFIQVEWVATSPRGETSSLFTYERLTPSLPLRRGLEHSSLRKFIGSNSIAMVIIIATQMLIVRTGWFKTSGGWRTNTEE